MCSLSVLALLASGMFAAAAAPAATVRVDVRTTQAGPAVLLSDVVIYTAEPGEANDVTIRSDEATATIADPGAAITAGHGCVANGPSRVTCASPNIGPNVDVRLGDHDDRVTVGELPASIGRSVLDGGPGDDVLSGTSTWGATFRPGPGDDIVRCSGLWSMLEDSDEDADVYDCDGNAWLSYEQRTVAARVDLLAGTGPDGDELEGVDAVTGGAGDDALLGTDGQGDFLLGGPGDDRIDGRGGPDLLGGEEGDDLLIGGEGADALSGYGGEDVLDGGAGDDDIQGGDGDDRLLGGAGDDELGEGVNVEPGDDLLRGGPGDDTLDGGPGIDSYEGDGGAGCSAAACPGGSDVISARDGVAEQISCGPDEDRATIDPVDVTVDLPAVQDQCERVDGAAPPSRPVPQTGPPPAPPPPFTPPIPTVAGGLVTPSSGPVDRTRPRLTGLSVGPLSAGRAPTVRFTLSERATVTFTFRRRVGAGSAARFTTIGPSVQRRAAKGRNRIRLDGRIGGRALPPGRYRLIAVARDGAGNRSLATRADMRVLAGPAALNAG